MLHVPVSRNPAGVDELVRRYQIDRDERARDKLLRQYVPIIKSAANRWANHWGVNRDDAIQEASLGFLRALETYDPLVASLEGYARLWMRSKIGYARRAELTVAVPAHAFNDAGTVGRETVAVYRSLLMTKPDNTL